MEKAFVKNIKTDEERALYGLKNAVVSNCEFSGEADGESALKETENVEVENCRFHLRYPLWHTRDFYLHDSEMTETARAALWYAQNGKIEKCTLNGVKLLRESGNITVKNCNSVTSEFGWRCKDVTIENSAISSDYFLFGSKNVKIKDLEMKGKYSFQYIENMTVENSVLDTKDAFWHTENVTVKNCVVKGEYLGWYSSGLTLINCKIIGTQPLCYCKNLTLENCTMENTDLAFEYSSVNATVTGNVLSVKNPLDGKIVADEIGEIILKDSLHPCNCIIETRK